eukprot:gb/GECG01002728.1/.p1 GENE.gb/GECG01002728.1/~~gb/GECG01002728.1/.p1  ORF type:complete len:544 (+),score=38.97 gb/GECG01002728.1/:1-1632(+)
MSGNNDSTQNHREVRRPLNSPPSKASKKGGLQTGTQLSLWRVLGASVAVLGCTVLMIIVATDLNLSYFEGPMSSQEISEVFQQHGKRNASSEEKKNGSVPQKGPKTATHEHPQPQDAAHVNSYSIDKDFDNLKEFERIIRPARAIAYYANFKSHNLTGLHALAERMDEVRAQLPPNGMSERIPTPTPLPLSYHREKHGNFLWGSNNFQSSLKQWYAEQCRYQNTSYIFGVPGIEDTPKAKSNAELLQRSFQLKDVAYNDDIEKPVFATKGRMLEYPYCDLRRCPQDKYPFIYFIVPHRNRIHNLLRLVSSLRNATLRCDETPPWYECLCVYVSDYDTESKTPLSSDLDSAWKDRVRLLSRSPASGPWIKAKTYNSALRYIPTPSKRSLVFHVDADMAVTDTTFIDRGLKATIPGKQVAFPIVMGTKNTIKDISELFEHVLGKTLLNSENSWVRIGGQGMSWFYLYDDNIGFFGPTVNKTTWGGEDNLFYVQFVKLGGRGTMKRPVRYTDKSLWHIWHKQVMDWRISKDGMSRASKKSTSRKRG